MSDIFWYTSCKLLLHQGDKEALCALVCNKRSPLSPKKVDWGFYWGAWICLYLDLNFKLLQKHQNNIIYAQIAFWKHWKVVYLISLVYDLELSCFLDTSGRQLIFFPSIFFGNTADSTVRVFPVWKSFKWWACLSWKVKESFPSSLIEQRKLVYSRLSLQIEIIKTVQYHAIILANQIQPKYGKKKKIQSNRALVTVLVQVN